MKKFFLIFSMVLVSSLACISVSAEVIHNQEPQNVVHPDNVIEQVKPAEIITHATLSYSNSETKLKTVTEPSDYFFVKSATDVLPQTDYNENTFFVGVVLFLNTLITAMFYYINKSKI